MKIRSRVYLNNGDIYIISVTVTLLLLAAIVVRPAGGDVRLPRSLSSEILIALLGSPQFCSGAEV